MFEIREINNKDDWEDFLIRNEPRTFLQSWNWGEFQKALGHKIWRIGFYGSDQKSPNNERRIFGAALIVKIEAKRGTFLFVPQGPIIKTQNSGLKVQNDNSKFKIFIDYLRKIAEKENCGFIRISPILLKGSENEKLFRDLGFRPAPTHMHAETMWILDIETSDILILKNMRKTTRYLIHKAEKDGVEIIKSVELEHLKIFNTIYEETARRHNFTPYSRDYLEKELLAFKGDNQIQIFLAKYREEFLAGAMIIFWGSGAFYHQGASLNKYPQIPAPYLLQWEAIKEAKRRGMKFYNFWGISPQDETNFNLLTSDVNRLKFWGGRHPWAGLTLFKKGFGGFSEEYLPAQDLILKSSYWLNYMIEKTRRIKRGL